MGIISRLWREVWEAEQRHKDSVADQRFAEQVKDAELSRQAYKAIPTKLQAYAEDHGAIREAVPTQSAASMYGYAQGISSQMQNAQQNLNNLYQQALYQQAAIQQQANLNTYQAQNNLLNTSVNNSLIGGSIPGTPSQHSYTTVGSVGGYTGNRVASTGYTSVSSTGQVTTVPGTLYRHLGNMTRDTLFLALKGIEEAAMKAPKGNHPYDEQAAKLLDMRNFDGESVDMLQLCSFCVSNCYDPEPLVILLEGYGIKVEA